MTRLTDSTHCTLSILLLLPELQIYFPKTDVKTTSSTTIRRVEKKIHPQPAPQNLFALKLALQNAQTLQHVVPRNLLQYNARVQRTKLNSLRENV